MRLHPRHFGQGRPEPCARAEVFSEVVSVGASCTCGGSAPSILPSPVNAIEPVTKPVESLADHGAVAVISEDSGGRAPEL